MSTVAKLLVLAGLAVIALDAGGVAVFGFILVGIGLMFPAKQSADTSTARIEALEQYVRKLHRWIVDRETARGNQTAAPASAGSEQRPPAESVDSLIVRLDVLPEAPREPEPQPDTAALEHPVVAASEEAATPVVDAVPEVSTTVAASSDEPGVADIAEERELERVELPEAEEPAASSLPEPDSGPREEAAVADDGIATDAGPAEAPLAFPRPENAEPEIEEAHDEEPETAAAAFSAVTEEERIAAEVRERATHVPPAVHTARPSPPPKSLFDFEQILGTNWLARVGVAILVIGVSFFLAWQLRELGPAGKVTVGVIVGFAMLGAGIRVERNERYRILARAALAGGWALHFFVSWAAHHLEPTRIIDSPPVALVLMLVVGGAMVAHTLRYRSQVVTGLAFILAFSTVALNQADVFGLTANVVLALAFSAVVVRMRWFELEIAGIVAAYLNHYLWLRPVLLPEHGAPDLVAATPVSVGILLLYWAIFRASFVIRRAPDETSSVLAGLLNSGLLLMVLRTHPASAEASFRILLALGVVELVLSRLPVMRTRRQSFVALTTLGTMFVTAAIPLRFAPSFVTVAWLVNAIVLSVVGILTGERAYRRLGTLTAVAAALQLVFFPLGRVIVGTGPSGPQRGLGVVALAVAAWLLIEATLLVRRWSDLYPEPIERYLVRALGYGGVGIGLAAGWLTFPHTGTAVFWMMTAVLLAWLGRRMANDDLAMHATLFGSAALLRTLGYNVGIEGPVLDLAGRASTVAAVALLLYALARMQRGNATTGGRLGHLVGLWAGTGLFALLAAHEIPQLQLALAWTAFAFALALIGRRFDSRALLIQAHLLIALAVTWLLAKNFPDDTIAFGLPGLTWRTVSTAVLVALLYALVRWNATGPLATPNRLASLIPSWVAAALLALLVFTELPDIARGLGWSLLGFGLAVVGHKLRNGHFIAQANSVAIVAAAWMFASGFQSGTRLLDAPLPVSWRTVSASALAGLLYALSRWNAPWKHITLSAGTVAPRVFANLLLMVLLWHELERPAVVVGWTLLGFALLFAGRRAKLFDLVAQANVAGAAAALRILVINLPSNAIALDEPWPLSWRIPASLLVIGLLYTLASWNRDAAQDASGSFARTWRNVAPLVPEWSATSLLVLLAWYEFVPAAVAVAWTLIAMLLLEAGLRRQSRSLLLQANGLFLLVFGRVFVVNMNIDDFGTLGARVFTVAPIAAAMVYAYWRSDEALRERALAPRWLAPLHAWLGMACVVALLRFQLAADAVVAGWAALTFLLMAFASVSGRRIFAHIATAVTLMTLARAGLHNLYERSYFPSPGTMDRWLWVGGAAALLFASLFFAFRLRTGAPPAGASGMRRAFGWLDARPEQVLFFVSLLLVTGLIGIEMRSGMLTVAWGLEGVMVFVFALLVGERSFRLAGLALLLLCVGKIFALDFWALGLRDKALTGIVIGLALIGVSILYSRKRETILKYL